MDESVQEKLLGNVDRALTAQQQAMLDAPLSAKELQQAVYDLKENKSPGLDGFTAEFYKKFWSLIKDHYNVQKYFCYHSLYKGKVDTDDLKNYRPISLNVDLKILTKALTNRLKKVLPSIIHFTQTAVDGRRIDNTVHMLCNFLFNWLTPKTWNLHLSFWIKKKLSTALTMLFLYKTMRPFGIGPVFIHWICQIYSNATTRVKVNGFLSDNIPLRCGVWQGCPLSPLIYILIIEMLALQFRKNPDIVGFSVGGEKIVSMHYADNVIITIIQNRCFNEVIKDVTAFEQASVAKVNQLWED